ncbi:MAG TPA: hypothetical protein VFL97_07510 [Nitrococcus sp.]|nr:hypothetical protein [Nitrococcus sp.]
MDKPPENQPPTPDRQHELIPGGYRQGLITAITVLLGFSLAFFRFWGFEAAGKWTPGSIVAAGTLILAVLLQLIALVRSLRLEDDEPSEYRKTVRWFTASVVVMLIGLSIAVVVFPGAF